MAESWDGKAHLMFWKSAGLVPRGRVRGMVEKYRVLTPRGGIS